LISNSFNISSIKYQKTKEKDFELGMDGEKISLLLFYNVSNRIAKTLSEKERKKLAKDIKLIKLKILEWLKLKYMQ